MPASVLNSLAVNLSASQVILPPKVVESGANFAKELDRAKDSGKANEQAVTAKPQAARKASGVNGAQGKGAKASKKNSANSESDAPQPKDVGAEVALDPSKSADANSSSEPDAKATAEKTGDKSKSKVESQSADSITPIVNRGIPVIPVAAEVPADPKNAGSSPASQSPLDRTADVTANVPADGTANATGPKGVDAKAKEATAASDGNSAKPSTTARGPIPIVAPLDENAGTTPLIAQTAKAQLMPQLAAVVTDGANNPIPTERGALEGVMIDKHAEGADNTSAQGQSLMAQGTAPHSPVGNPMQSTAVQPREPLPPEARFAEANHSAIVSNVQTRLLPHGGSMQIRLDPPELGALQVSVEMRNGLMTATFQTSNEDATRLLSHSLGQLKTALEAQGVTVEKIQVQQSPKNEQSQSQEEQSPQQHREEANARQEQQRREILNRMWRRVSGGSDPVDLVA